MQQQAIINNNPNGSINTLSVGVPQYPNYPPNGNHFSAPYGSPIYYENKDNNLYPYNGQTANQYGQPINPYAKGY